MAISVIDTGASVLNTTSVSVSLTVQSASDIIWAMESTKNGQSSTLTYNGGGAYTQLHADAQVGNSGDSVKFGMLTELDIGTHNLTLAGSAYNGLIACVLHGADLASVVEEAYSNASSGGSVFNYTRDVPDGGVFLGGVVNAGYVTWLVTSGTAMGYWKVVGGLDGAACGAYTLNEGSQELAMLRANTAGRAGAMYTFKPRISGGWQIWYSKMRERFEREIANRRRLYDRLYNDGAVAI